jgi:hypothetical protein
MLVGIVMVNLAPRTGKVSVANDAGFPETLKVKPQ